MIKKRLCVTHIRNISKVATATLLKLSDTHGLKPNCKNTLRQIGEINYVEDL